MKKTFARILFWDDQCPRSPGEQMACDEALGEVTEAPVLRIYRWAEPALTFGYSQRLQNVQTLATGRPLMRRWTGGGTVFHGEELTLGLAIPTCGALTGLSSSQIYQAIHKALLPAIRQILPDAKLVALEDCRCGPVCFESPVAYDIVAGSRKILGGAMRRSLQGILYQGSLHASVPPLSLAEALADEVLPLENLPDLEKSAACLVTQRYGDPAWLNLR